MSRKNYSRPDGTTATYHSDSDISLESGGRKGKKKHGGVVGKVVSVIFIILQVVLLILGIAVLSLGVLLFKGLKDHQVDQDPAIKHIPMYMIGGGVAIIVLCIIAIAAASARRKMLGYTYIVLVMFLVAAQIYALIQLSKLEGHTKEYFSRRWDALQPPSRFAIQMWKNCCGFEGDGDRSQVPCPEGATNGCWGVLQEKVKATKDLITKILYGSIGGHCAMIIMMFVILYL
jgi:hypothetical protein